MDTKENLIESVVQSITTTQSSRDKGWDFDDSHIDYIFADVARVAAMQVEEGFAPLEWINAYFPISLGASWMRVWSTEQYAEALCFELSKFSVGVRKRIAQEYKDASCITRMVYTFTPTVKDYRQFEQSEEFRTLIHMLTAQFNAVNVDISM